MRKKHLLSAIAGISRLNGSLETPRIVSVEQYGLSMIETFLNGGM